MSQTHHTSWEKLQEQFNPIITLLNRQQILRDISVRQSEKKQDLIDSLVNRQIQGELRYKLTPIPAADISHLLEMLTPHHRLIVWDQLDIDKAGDVLWEVADGVAEYLINSTPHDRLLMICKVMDADALSQIADHLSKDILAELERFLTPRTKSWLKASVHYPENSVGRLMSHEMLVSEFTLTVNESIQLLRNMDDFPEQTYSLLVVDHKDRLVGQIPFKTLLLKKPDDVVSKIMDVEVITFSPHEDASAAAHAFERYNLISSPVVDDKGRLVGCLSFDSVMDFVREEAEDNALRREGLTGGEDLFGPIFKNAKRRWLWLAINLLTAFIASRVINLFEGSIEKFVALAALMPIIASIGGNTGNQTVALVIRGLALSQINFNNLRYLIFKEIGISIINGLIWGSLMGILTWAIYHNITLGLVMTAAMMLNLILGAAVGIVVPMLLHRMDRDPAFGSTVFLTFTTDSMGFLIFLGLATLLM
ncbi:MAG: magnesium transporter [Desulfobacterales bacterium]|nr:magnesium transporter [Desulfobacterales bacterium]